MSTFQAINFTDAQYICKIGDQATHLYFLQEGEVELLNGSGQVFGRITKGQSFGEAAILKGGIRGASIRAKGDVVVCKMIKNDDAVELLSSYSPLLVVIIEGLLLQQMMNNAIKYS